MSHHNPVLHSARLTKKRKKLFDKIVLTASVVSPLTGVPQVWLVFTGSTEGVSLLSWAGFMAFSALFLAYGLMHRVTPMIVVNSLWLVVDGLVIVGHITNNMA